MRPSLGVRCSENTLDTATCPYFHNLPFEILMQVVLSATLSRLLPLQLVFERFQYIGLSSFWFAKIKVSHSNMRHLINMLFNVRLWSIQ